MLVGVFIIKNRSRYTWIQLNHLFLILKSDILVILTNIKRKHAQLMYLTQTSSVAIVSAFSSSISLIVMQSFILGPFKRISYCSKSIHLCYFTVLNNWTAPHYTLLKGSTETLKKISYLFESDTFVLSMSMVLTTCKLWLIAQRLR